VITQRRFLVTILKLSFLTRLVLDQLTPRGTNKKAQLTQREARDSLGI